MSTRLRIDPDISRRFDVLKTLLVFGVVMIHAERVILAYMPDPPTALRAVTVFMTPNLLQVCVPLFFAISGYLFFFSFTPTPAGYGRMALKKLRGLGLPYLFLNLAAVLIILAFRKIPYIGDFHTVEERGVLSLITGIGGLPIISPLWFLRDLLALFLLSPFFWLLARAAPLWGLVGMYAAWNLLPDGYLGFLNFRGVFFFHLGLVLAGVRPSLAVGPGVARLVTLAFPLLMLLGTLWLLSGLDQAAFPSVHNASLAAGVVFFWLLSGTRPLHDNRFLLSLAPYSFFLYLLHEPTLSYLIYLVRFVLPPTGVFTGLLDYFGLAAATCALVLATGRLMAGHLPWLYGFLTGFRPRPAAVGVPASGNGTVSSRGRTG